MVKRELSIGGQDGRDEVAKLMGFSSTSTLRREEGALTNIAENVRTETRDSQHKTAPIKIGVAISVSS